ncbi:GDSL-type esterase/lipase family protein [Kingella negevensis]|uniref:GDSL-type esterase/lipase family protein n=1 Tax=Kingella negevensis TaxID=1522312 RepID=UPI00050A2FF3|nr:GDSL-type esterase/lipase family protein [Kingella negevensis]MDK4688593.1 GDSL-type esterase/lipase family protein [Kingella negevensis]WII91663.1 GDSL-type esterase/lipase family protein [Kingella negevensis]
MNRRQFLILSTVLLAAACRNGKKYSKLAKGSTVLCLGDSLTEGYGAPKGTDYPTQLAEITGWKIINGGVSGDTSEQALGRLSGLMSQEPKLVIVSIGGNDFLQKIPESTTRVNIAKILDIIQNANIPVVLVRIPYFTTGALLGNVSEHPLYDEIATQYRIPLLKDAWADILGDKSLKSDMVHANADGYRQFAEELADFLKQQGFL